MNPELYNKLIHKYPNLFKNVNPISKHSISLFGIETNGPGWDNLIETLCSLIDCHVKYNKCPPVSITQIKEKCGTLRFYIQGGDKIVEGMVMFAESYSAYLCEKCGNSATLHTEGWMTTLCDEHFQKQFKGVKEYLQAHKPKENKMAEERKGWICPKCNKVMSPDVLTCNCEQATNESSTSNRKVLLNE